MQRLEGIRVLVTRPRERSRELCFLLEDEGAQVSQLPLLELLPPEDPRPLRAAAERIQRYAWIVFTSPSGVQALVEAVREAGATERLYRPHIAAVGPRTAQAVREYGLSVEVQPEVSTGLGLFEKLAPKLQQGDEVLLPAAQQGRRELGEALEEHGIRVTRIAAYRTAPAVADEQTLRALQAEPPEVILFASPRTAEAFLDATGALGPQLLRGAKVAVIGPTTGAALERMGFSPAAAATVPTPEGLVEAAIRAIRG